MKFTTVFTVLPLIAAVLATTLAPHHALAFEAALPQATSQALVAQVILKDRNSDLLIMHQELPKHSYTASAAAASYPTLKTETGNWPTPRVLSTRYAASTLQPLGAPLKLVGAASFYSRAGCLGCDPLMIMANGQPLNDNALTLAIPAHLVKYVGRQVRVTNPATGISVVALATDTGGFNHSKYNTAKWGPRVADLTIATKNAIGMKGGLGPVELEIL